MHLGQGNKPTSLRARESRRVMRIKGVAEGITDSLQIRSRRRNSILEITPLQFNPEIRPSEGNFRRSEYKKSRVVSHDPAFEAIRTSPLEPEKILTSLVLIDRGQSGRLPSHFHLTREINSIFPLSAD